MRRKLTRRGRHASSDRRVAVLAVMLTGAGFGCGASRTQSPFVSQADARINIEVINHNFQDATLHAVWPGRRIRLGTVSGTRSANFMLPWDRSYELRIEIDMLAGSRCVTLPIWADPGDIIILEIQPRLQIGLDCF